MKKAMWIIAAINLAVTAAVLQLLPETVPMHYNIYGEADRWGSKYESLLIPGMALALSLLMQLFIMHFEKKTASGSDKEKASALSNTKVMKIIGVSMVSVFTVLQGFLLYNSYTGGTQSGFDFGRVTCILCGALFAVLGNFMPKTKKNYLLGFRMKWSMYNDTTWMKTNRFGGAVLVAVGLLSILAAVLADAGLSLILMTGFLMLALVAVIVYSYSVYKKELEKGADGS